MRKLACKKLSREKDKQNMEDYVLGYLARKRESQSKAGDYLDIKVRKNKIR